MEYWKCSEVGIALPFAQKKEPDCKFVIAESLPEQGTRGVAPKPRKCIISAMFNVIAALHQYLKISCRKEPGGHFSGEAQSPWHPAYWPVHSRYCLHCTNNGSVRRPVLLPSFCLLYRGLHVSSHLISSVIKERKF